MYELSVLRKAALDLSGAIPGSCSDCRRSALRFLQDTQTTWSDLKTRKAQELFSPTDFQGTGAFRCDYECAHCGTRGVVIGRFTSDCSYEPEDEESNQTLFFPTSMAPAPLLFVPPDDTPDEVLTALKQAFALFWADPSSSAACCRAAIERLLDHLRIAKTRATSNGRRTWLTLHNRLKILEPSEPETAAFLMAAKWIGNDGAHERRLTRTDAVDAFELVMIALAHFFDHSRQRVARRAKQINTRQKPISTRRKKSGSNRTSRK